MILDPGVQEHNNMVSPTGGGAGVIQGPNNYQSVLAKSNGKENGKLHAHWLYIGDYGDKMITNSVLCQFEVPQNITRNPDTVLVMIYAPIDFVLRLNIPGLKLRFKSLEGSGLSCLFF